MKAKRYIKHITCRVDEETDMMIDRLTCSLEVNKSDSFFLQRYEKQVNNKKYT